LPAEVDAIIALADEPWKTIFSVAAMTGLRPALLGLSVDDLDFTKRQIFVRSHRTTCWSLTSNQE